MVGAGLAEEDKWTSVLAGEFGDHRAPVGRVEWNVTGYVPLALCLPPFASCGLILVVQNLSTVLSSAGDDGQIRFWKALSNVWRKIGAFNTHHVVEDSTIDAMDEE